jgi:adenylosuccinate synthase
MPADVVLGLGWGDEGKGKVVDYLAKDYDYVVRFNGGNNAGHTLVVNGHKVAVHALPSGVLHPHVNNIIGNGCVVDPEQLAKEINEFGVSSLIGRLFISHAAHVIVPSARMEDQQQGQKIGTTGRGIGPTYAAKMHRTGLRIENFIKGESNSPYSEDLIRLIKPFVTDTTHLLQTALASGANILLEGAQGTLLDVDHGTYPYVTSSNCTIGAALTGTGLNHKALRKVIGVVKAYSTRVGEGPFPTEQNNEIGTKLRELGREYGTTTGRNRRCGWLNYTELRKASQLNGVDEVAVTKLDVLDSFKTIPIGYSVFGNEKTINYQNWNGWDSPTKGLRDKTSLPQNAILYIQHISTIAKAPVTYISTSPEREDMIKL